MRKNGEDLGKLLLRLVLAVLLLFHGGAKLAHGIDPIRGMVAGHGLPALFAYGVYVGEVVAPLLVLLGVYSRAGGVLIAVNMVVAILLAHTGDLLHLSPHGGWALELQGFYLFGGLTVALLGAGRFSVGGVKGRWN